MNIFIGLTFRYIDVRSGVMGKQHTLPGINKHLNGIDSMISILQVIIPICKTDNQHIVIFQIIFIKILYTGGISSAKIITTNSCNLKL